MTDSDAKLRRDLAYQRKMVALCESRGQAWTADHYRRAVEYTERQLALPREQRSQYAAGAL